MLTTFAHDADRSQMVAISERDIIFDCPHCRGELVVDQDGAGMTLACSHCGRNVTVPTRVTATAIPAVRPDNGNAAAAAPDPRDMMRVFGFDAQPPDQVRKRLDELKLQLRENQSQTTEMRGHVNRATIELHRLQLKLQKFQDRQTAIEAELLAAKVALEAAPPTAAPAAAA